jgi:ABC-type sugar transport system permease subunit
MSARLTAIVGGRPGLALPASRRRGSARAVEMLTAYGYLLPALFILGVFSLGPFVYVFYASTLHAPAAATQSFVGADNYRYLLDPSQQSGFLEALKTTFLYVLGVVPAGVALSLGCALLLRRKLWGWMGFRLLFFLPFVTPALPTSIIWLWIFNPTFGLLNYLLQLVHLPTTGWIDDPNWALPSVIIYSLWQYAGFNTVIFLAGLSAIPRELEDAARVDGGSTLRVVRHITIPLLTPTVFFVFVVAVIESLKVFTPIYAMTGGGPAGATTTVGFFLYQDAFRFFHLDTASAVAVILFVITLIFTIAQTQIGRKWVFYR